MLIKKACAIASGEDPKLIKVTAAEVRQSLGEVIKNLAAMKTAEAAKANSEQLANA